MQVEVYDSSYANCAINPATGRRSDRAASRPKRGLPEITANAVPARGDHGVAVRRRLDGTLCKHFRHSAALSIYISVTVCGKSKGNCVSTPHSP